MCTAASVLSVNRSALTSLTQHPLHHPKIIPDEGGVVQKDVANGSMAGNL